MRRRVVIERGFLVTAWSSPSADVGFNVEPAMAFIEQPLFELPDETLFDGLDGLDDDATPPQGFFAGLRALWGGR